MQQQTAGHPLTGQDRPVCSSQTFPATPANIRDARRFLATILDGSPLAQDAVMCLAELANNAVVHSNSRLPSGTFTVRARLSHLRLLVEVEDHGGPWAPPSTATGHDSPSGRGLQIVAGVADAWDITPKTTADRRTAWFLLHIAAPASTSAARSAARP
jgi:anti-sigma regulatory factor (Ser/Thr protein kinase)